VVHTSLTHAQAQAKVNEARDHLISARQRLHAMEDKAAEMTASSWRGNQSQLFLQKLQQQIEDMRSVIQRLEHHIETGERNMTGLVNLESD
jgi:ubiquinone biosynthesis protein UbiJ